MEGTGKRKSKLQCDGGYAEAEIQGKSSVLSCASIVFFGIRF
ncbi:unnamed protein product [Musa acuminata subsp. burmannicoides]